MTDTPTALKPETVERLNKLFNEVTDMNVAKTVSCRIGLGAYSASWASTTFVS